MFPVLLVENVHLVHPNHQIRCLNKCIKLETEKRKKEMNENGNGNVNKEKLSTTKNFWKSD